MCIPKFPFMNDVLNSASSKQEGLDSGKVLNVSTASAFSLTSLISHPQESERGHLVEVRIHPVLSNYRGGLVTEGVVEVKHSGKWRHVCDRGWDLSSSRVACGMLGFPAAEAFDQPAYR